MFNINNISEYIQRHSALKKDDFHIDISDAGYGLKHANPLDGVKFFRKEDLKPKILTKTQFSGEDISMLYTKAFAERYAKLYIKNVNNFKIANDCFKSYF